MDSYPLKETKERRRNQGEGDHPQRKATEIDHRNDQPADDDAEATEETVNEEERNQEGGRGGGRREDP